MKSFSSVDELIYYINTSTGNSSSYIGGPLDSQYFSQATRAPEAAGTSTTNTPQAPEAAPALQAPQGSSAASSVSYSTTNIQVAGVDEADTVKTDGTYIYVATNQAGYYFGGSSSQNNAVFIRECRSSRSPCSSENCSWQRHSASRVVLEPGR